MKINLKKSALVYAIAGAISLSTLPITACSVTMDEKEITTSDDLFDDIKKYTSVVVLSDINVMDSIEPTSKVVSVLKKGQEARVAAILSNDIICVEYEDDLYGYIKNDANIKQKVSYSIPKDSIRKGYLLEDAEMYDGKEFTIVPQYEFCEVYQDYEDDCLVKAGDKVGYINKDKIENVKEDLAVVDISDQTVKFYENNKVTFESDVVTGKPSTPTHVGFFEIKDKKHKAILRGPGYASPVNDFAPFDNGIGFHDATWRNESDFGGNTYLTNGSHGCVNMKKDDAPVLMEKLEIGSKVLVKK